MGAEEDRGTAQALAAALATLFPPFVATAVRPIPDLPPAAHPDEERLVAGAGPLRRREFLGGRACAHAALSRIGRDDGPIGVGPQRQPLWPDGTAGSIAHAAGIAAAAAARTSDVWGLGLDLERLHPPLDPAVAALVVAPGEQAAAGGHALAPYGPKLAFCVKEAVYKCLFPVTGWQLDFHDVTVVLDLPRRRFLAAVDDRLRVHGLDLQGLRGRFAVQRGYVLAGLCIAPVGPPTAPSQGTTGSGGPGPGRGR